MNSREAFEAWCEEQGKYPSLEYSAWVAWQAATERAAKLCEDDECDHQDEYRCGTTARIAADIRGHDRA